MRITQVRTRQVDAPLPEPFHPAWAPGAVETKIRLVYVRIDTDAGLYGIAGHEFFGAEEQAVARVATYLVGEDPLRIEKHAGTLRYLWPNGTWFEFPHDPPAFPASAYQQTLKTPLVVKDGLIQVPQEPGWGVELQDWIFEGAA